MISDEPDEDADILDDETLLRTYLGVTPNRPAGETTTELPDWPQRHERVLSLDLDGETIAWFKARHIDWQSAMASVLRAWVAVQTRRGQLSETTEDKAESFQNGDIQPNSGCTSSP